jgi:hypothetical protein
MPSQILHTSLIVLFLPLLPHHQRLPTLSKTHHTLLTVALLSTSTLGSAKNTFNASVHPPLCLSTASSLLTSPNESYDSMPRASPTACQPPVLLSPASPQPSALKTAAYGSLIPSTSPINFPCSFALLTVPRYRSHGSTPSTEPTLPPHFPASRANTTSTHTSRVHRPRARRCRYQLQGRTLWLESSEWERLPWFE